MIDRFIPPARNLIATAAREARALGSPTVGDEHLALAIVVGIPRLLLLPPEPGPWINLYLSIPSAEDARALLRRDTHDALATLGISLDEIESRVEETFGAGAWEEAAGLGQMRFSRTGKQTLELALRRALRLHRRQVLVNDLLAGVVAADGRGKQLLGEIGVDLDELQRRLDTAPMFVPGF